MEAGNLRHKITLQRPAGGDLSDPNGATEWEDYATTNASVLPLRGRELWEAKAAQSTIDHRIILRWRPGVKRSTRVLLGNRKFEVQYIIDQGERHEWLQLMCRELEE